MTAHTTETADGSWCSRKRARRWAVMTDGSDGLCENALAIVDGVILLSDDSQRVYAYAGEAYLNDVMMDKLGVSVMLLGEDGAGRNPLSRDPKLSNLYQAAFPRPGKSGFLKGLEEKPHAR